MSFPHARDVTFRIGIVFLLSSVVSAALTKATCQMCDPTTSNCDGFLPSLPLRTGPQIVTTALATGILAAWQSAGSGQGGLLRGIFRTLVQAFVPEIALFRLHDLGYAMHPRFENWVVPIRDECRCDEFRPTKAQVVAVYLGLLAVRGEAPPPRSRRADRATDTSDMTAVDEDQKETEFKSSAGNLLRRVNASSGWRDVKFHHHLQPGYRLVKPSEAIYLPHLFYALPKGRLTLFSTPVPQTAMVLLLLQALYYIVYVIARAASHRYITVIEWFFIPTSSTLVALGITGILWEPAWRDIAHINVDLGAPLPSYPWRRSSVTSYYFGFVASLIFPIGPVTTLVAWATDRTERPVGVAVPLLVGGIIWLLGLLALVAVVFFGNYRPFRKGPGTRSDQPNTEPYGAYYTLLLVIARAAMLAIAIYELDVLPSEAYKQMSWSQYLPHL